MGYSLYLESLRYSLCPSFSPVYSNMQQLALKLLLELHQRVCTCRSSMLCLFVITVPVLFSSGLVSVRKKLTVTFLFSLTSPRSSWLLQIVAQSHWREPVKDLDLSVLCSGQTEEVASTCPVEVEAQALYVPNKELIMWITVAKCSCRTYAPLPDLSIQVQLYIIPEKLFDLDPG